MTIVGTICVKTTISYTSIWCKEIGWPVERRCLNWDAPPGRFFRHFIVFLGDISWYLGPEDLSILFLQSRTYVGLFLPPFYSWYKNPHAVNSIWYTSETVLLEKWEITKGTFHKRRSYVKNEENSWRKEWQIKHSIQFCDWSFRITRSHTLKLWLESLIKFQIYQQKI